MYNFVIRNIANKYDYTELIKIFLSPEEFELYTEDEFDALMGENKSCPNTVYFNDELSEDRNFITRQIYGFLNKERG